MFIGFWCHPIVAEDCEIFVIFFKHVFIVFVGTSTLVSLFFWFSNTDSLLVEEGSFICNTDYACLRLIIV